MPYILSQSGPVNGIGVLWAGNVADCTGVSVDVEQMANGNVITVETSPDNSVWTAFTGGFKLGAGGIGAGQLSSLNGSTFNTKGNYYFPTNGVNYIRFSLTSYGSGYVNIFVEPTSERVAVTANAIDASQGFGLRGDGLSNDGPAIEAAIRAAISLGRPLYIPAGTYGIGTTINVGTPGTLDLLCDAGTVFKGLPSLTDKMFWFQRPYTENNRVVWRGGRVDTSKVTANTSSTNGEVYFGEGYDDCLIQDVSFYAGVDYTVGGGDSGLFYVGRTLRVEGCRFQGHPDAAIYLSARQTENFGEIAVISNCTFIKTNDGVIAKRQFIGTKVIGCHFDRVVTGTVFGEADTTLRPGKHNVIANNTYYKIKGRAIDVRWSDFTVVTGNRIIDTGLDLSDAGQASSVGIAISGSNYCAVTGNVVIQQSGPATSGHNGIQIEGKVLPPSTTVNSTYNSIVGNVIKGYNVGIIEMDTNQVSNTMANNRIDCTTEFTRAGLTSTVHAAGSMWMAAATGSYTEIRSVGQSTIGLQFYASGLAGHRFVCKGSTNSPVFEAVPGADNPVNYLQARGHPTTATPILAAVGADTNINLGLLPKGTAYIDAQGPVRLPQYAIAGLPSASAFARCIVYVTDGAGSKRFAVSNGSNWLWPDGTTVS